MLWLLLGEPSDCLDTKTFDNLFYYLLYHGVLHASHAGKLSPSSLDLCEPDKILSFAVVV